MAEHSAVNRRVVGSSPTWGALRLVNDGKPFCYVWRRGNLGENADLGTELEQNRFEKGYEIFVDQRL